MKKVLPEISLFFLLFLTFYQDKVTHCKFIKDLWSKNVEYPSGQIEHISKMLGLNLLKQGKAKVFEIKVVFVNLLMI